jgi:hypothetical protein
MDWEKRYATWIQNKVDPNFFYQHGIETDCADVVIGLRWIFSRMNGLPAGNHLAGSGELFTQDDTLWAWRRLNRHKIWYKDERFIRALNYVMNNTTSWSLAQDSYPIQLTRAALIPGRYLITNKNGSWHTRIFHKSDYENEIAIPLFTLASTSPRELRVLIQEVYLDERWPTKGESEILAHRWPVKKRRKWILKGAKSHRDYSEEQFTADTLDHDPLFYKALFKRIKPKHSILGLIHSSIDELKSYTQQRIDVVQKGSLFCATNNCTSGTQNWEVWSTPGRDLKLLKKFKKFEEMFSTYQWERGEIYHNWLHSLRTTNVKINALEISLADVYIMLENNLLSSDPTQPFSVRWGMDYKNKFEIYFLQLSQLLKKRRKRIDSSRCENGCRTDSGQWWDLHTYHIDREISELYNLFANYCSHYDYDKRCLLAKNEIGQRVINIGIFSKPLSEMEKQIPFFNSDPRAPLSHKWGMYTNYYTTVIPPHQSISISENGVAILDNNRGYNLKTQQWIPTLENSFKLFFFEKKLYTVVELEGQLGFFSYQNNVWKEEFSIEGNKDLFHIELSIDHELIFTIKDSLYLLHNSTLKLLNNSFHIHSIVKNKFSEFTIVWGEQSGLLLDDQGNHTFLDYRYHDKIEVLDKIGDTIYVQYSDKDSDEYFAASINLETGKFASLVESKENHKLEFIDRLSLSAVISFGFNNEFPKLMLYNMTSREFTELGTFLTDVVMDSEGSELLVTTRGRWDDDLLTTQKLISLKSGELYLANIATEVQGVSSRYIFHLSDGNYNRVENRSSEQSFELPQMIAVNTSTSAYEKVSSNDHYFTWRFNAGHGDLEGAGGICLNEISLDGQREVIPTFSLGNFYLERKLARMNQIQQKINKSNVLSGVYFVYGPSVFLWIAPR